jgi:predicted MFS family arabinose efflux permease
LAFGGLIALAVAIGVGRFVYTPILPFMVANLGWAKAEAGLVASANFAGYLVGALIAATSLLDGSRRRWLLGALLVSALTTATTGLASPLAYLLPLRFLAGVASAFVMVFASALVLERLAAAGEGRLAALHFAGVGSGIAISAVLVSLAAAAGLGWRVQWLGSGLLALGGLFLVARLVPDREERSAIKAAESDGGGLIALIIAYGLFGFGYVITATFLVDIVRGSPAIQPLEPMIWLVVGLSAAPSLVVWTGLARRAGVLRAFALAALLEAVGVVLSVLWLAPVGTVLAAALLGGTFMGLTALGLIAARERATGDPRRALAMMTAAFGLGQIIGPTLAGVLFDRSGSFLPATMIAAAALLLAAILAWQSDRTALPDRRPAGQA